MGKNEIYSELNNLSRKAKKSNSASIILNTLNNENLWEDEARELIKLWDIKLLIKNLDKFTKLSNEIAAKLIQKWFTDDVAKNLSSFYWLDKKTAKILMKDRCWSVAYELRRFENLDDNIAKLLINNWEYDQISFSISSFSNLSLETLLSLLMNTKKHRNLLVINSDKFWIRWNPNEEILNYLKRKWKVLEYKKLKEFYDLVTFEKNKNSFENRRNLSQSFDFEVVKEAIKYWKGNLILWEMENYIGDYNKLIDLLIDTWYCDWICKNLWKLWWKNIDRNWLVEEMALNNKYNELLKNIDNFVEEWVSEKEIAEQIIRGWSPEIRDCVRNLSEYSDDDSEWDWINYNLEICNAIKNKKKDDFLRLIKYFQIDYSPLSSNNKLPSKLKDLLDEKFWINMMLNYKNLFN